jgi:hypothetical protein
VGVANDYYPSTQKAKTETRKIPNNKKKKKKRKLRLENCEFQGRKSAKPLWD